MRRFGSVLLFLCGMAGVAVAQNRPLELLVPAYFYPAGAADKLWGELAAAGKAGVPVTVIVNPGSGPGKQLDPNYARVIALVQKAGVKTVGYVSTRYGKRDAKEVEADVKTWLKLYPSIEGFFLDEQSSKQEDVAKYQALCAFIRQELPKARIVSNPGTVCDAGYFAKGGPDVICVFENAGSLAKYAPPAKFQPAPGTTAGLVHTTPKGVNLADEVGLARKHGFGMVFVTDDRMPNPWDTLPTYWPDLLKAAK